MKKQIKFSAETIAGFLNGKVEGNAAVEVSSVSKIEQGKAGTLSFLANPKYSKYIYTTEASIVLINNDFVLEKETPTTLIRVPDAYQAFAGLLELYAQSKTADSGIDSLAFIHETASLGEDAYVGAFAYIGKNVKIGKNAKIYPHAYIGNDTQIGDNITIFSGAKIYHECQIGSNCIIHAGAIIGADGFGFAPQTDSNYRKIPQIGNVIIENNVEIGANTTIDRATMGSTILHEGVKLDNLVQIAHNVEVGKNTVMAAMSAIAGSAKVGEFCMIGGQVGIAGHTTVANRTMVGAQAGVSSPVKKEGRVLLGTPAFDLRDARRSMVVFKRLPDMQSDITKLKKEIEELKKMMK